MIIRSPIEKRRGKTNPGDEHRIANRLRRYFAPASIMPPPGSIKTQTGNRNTIVSTNISANSNPTDSAQIQLNGGSPNATLNWTFATPFTIPPLVTCTAVTAFSGGPAELTLAGSPTKTGVIVQSSQAGDNRLINLHAVQNNQNQ